MNDLWIEPFLALTITEQLSLIVGIKLLLISELMLFFACFRCLINFRFISNAFSTFFSFPLLSSYSFPIPFPNLPIPLFSSLPIQAAQIFIKIGFPHSAIEGIAHSLSFGTMSLTLQCKEFLYSYYSLSYLYWCYYWFISSSLIFNLTITFASILWSHLQLILLLYYFLL